MQAIALNGVAVEMNRRAFLWGRRAAHEQAAVERHALPAAAQTSQPPTLDEIVARRSEELTAYQDAGYAARYRRLVERVRDIEAQRVGAGSTRLAAAVRTTTSSCSPTRTSTRWRGSTPTATS